MTPRFIQPLPSILPIIVNILKVCATDLRDSYRYCRDYLLIANFVVMALVPFLLLVIFNSLTFKIIRQSCNEVSSKILGDTAGSIIL